MSVSLAEGRLNIDSRLYSFLLPQLSQLKTPLDDFWNKASEIFEDLSAKNLILLSKRELLQKQIDEFYRCHKLIGYDKDDYIHFLEAIGYLDGSAKVGQFNIETENLDDEISVIAGPQLVVPSMNARYALNAANARFKF